MKIALISDIHGNLPALEAVMKDIHQRKADKIICLGDIIGKGPSSKEAIDICRSHCDMVIRGNWDTALYQAYLALQQDKKDEVNDRELWYIHDAGFERIAYFGTLPHCVELYVGGKLVRLFHAHPLNFNRYFDDSPVEQRMELFQCGENAENKRQSDVAVYADIHSAYMQTLNGRILLNTGSVGNPLDLTQASYVILEGEEGCHPTSSFNVQFVRVPYDIERAVLIAKSSSVPDLQGYISELTTATYYHRQMNRGK